MNYSNQKMIDAIIRKAEAYCPGALALIGVYGSAATGDTHAKSDLDLLLLINDDSGYRLAETFILDDVKIGYDIYCTTWRMLESDAECNHAQLSKLLDSKIVYVGDQSALSRLKNLQTKAIDTLASDIRFEKALDAFEQAKSYYAECFLLDSISDVRFHAGAVINQLLNCVMLYHGKYFHLGTKRVFDEMLELGLDFDMKSHVLDVIRADSVVQLRDRLTLLMRTVKDMLKHSSPKEVPSARNISGTFEEIFSNWRNKMPEAAENKDLYSSFMNLAFFQHMLREIEETVSIQKLDLLGKFDPFEIQKNVDLFDSVLNNYLDEYRKAGILPKTYKNIDAFIDSYLA